MTDEANDSTDDETTEGNESAEGSKKAFGTPSPSEPNDAEPPGEAAGASSAGESTTRHGEDVSKQEQEAGRFSTGPEGPVDRPTGESTPRDMGGIDVADE